MKKELLSIILMITAMTLWAQSPVVVNIWPNGAPNSSGLTGEEIIKEGGRLANVTVPTLTIYPAKKSNGMAVIACPGGGYVHLAIRHEGHDMADWFNQQGITYAVLKYRMPNGHMDVPLSDLQEAIRLMKRHANEWNLDPNKVGVMGASAGGNLASTSALKFTSKEDRPDFQVLLYTRNKLPATSATPPAFIACSYDDHTIPPEGSVDLFMSLIGNGVSASLHIYPQGGHGWGYKDEFTNKREWTGELEKWLIEMNKQLSKK